MLLDEPAHAFCARGGAAGSPSGADTTEDESGVSTSGQGQGAAQNNPLALLMQEALQAGRLVSTGWGACTAQTLMRIHVAGHTHTLSCAYTHAEGHVSRQADTQAWKGM